MPQHAVIIVAGGLGKRMDSGIPKQFLLLSGLPVLMRTIRAFYLYDPTILFVLALPESYHAYWKDLCEKYNFKIQHEVIKGGEQRFNSVKNSLAVIPDECYVAIHDGVRPLVSQKTITNAFLGAEENGNAIPVVPVNDSMRKVSRKGNEPVPRDQFRIVQTPQVFRAKDIKEAYSLASHDDFTDDATVLEETGVKLFLVDGNHENIKITQPSDLLFAEAVLLKASLSD